MNREAHGAEHFDPARYPALMEFLPAYLNEDFGEEYGTAAAAFSALVADATGEQIRNVKKEWAALRRAFSEKPMRDLQHALVLLGVAWHPQSEQELAAVDEILNRPQA